MDEVLSLPDPFEPPNVAVGESAYISVPVSYFCRILTNHNHTLKFCLVFFLKKISQEERVEAKIICLLLKKKYGKYFDHIWPNMDPDFVVRKCGIYIAESFVSECLMEYLCS